MSSNLDILLSRKQGILIKLLVELLRRKHLSLENLLRGGLQRHEQKILRKLWKKTVIKTVREQASDQKKLNSHF